MFTFCSLFSGSSGNALFISTGKTKLLLDAGKSGKSITAAMESIGEHPSNLTAIVVTHEHTDHTSGVGVLSRRYHLPVYATGGTWKGMASKIGEIEKKNIHCFTIQHELEIGDIAVRPFNIPHDACEPVGVSFFAENKKITVATDIGHLNSKLLQSLGASDLLLIESNHDVQMLRRGSYPEQLKERILGKYGHLSNETAGEAILHALEQGTRRFLLGHLSAENNTPELAYRSACNVLAGIGVKPGKEIQLAIAHRSMVGEVISV